MRNRGGAGRRGGSDGTGCQWDGWGIVGVRPVVNAETCTSQSNRAFGVRIRRDGPRSIPSVARSWAGICGGTGEPDSGLASRMRYGRAAPENGGGENRLDG